MQTPIKVAPVDEDKIRFTTAGTERAMIDAHGDFIIGDPIHQHSKQRTNEEQQTSTH